MYHTQTALFDLSTPSPLGRRTLLPLIGLTMLLGAWSTQSSADAQAGAALAQKGGNGVIACMTCHGVKGEGQAAAGFPRLAGQPKAYLEKQLKEFASGQRTSPQMAPIAKMLKPAQIQNLSDYYASLPAGTAAAPADTQAPAYAMGMKLATRGKWNDGMPACFSCHAPGGTGVPPHFPAIAGQPRAYTEAQLKAWQSNARHNDPQGLMKSVANKLTAAEISAVSLYLENPSEPGKDK